MLIRFLAPLAMCFGLLLAATPNFGLRDYDISRSEAAFEQIRSAPIVFVGTILSDSNAGEITPSKWRPEMSVRLHKLNVKVNEVLRGNIHAGLLTVFYFHIETSYEGNMLLGSWKDEPNASERKLFYVRPDQDVLRTACDVVNRCVEDVLSGDHPKYEEIRGQPFDQKLAYIFLTKGTGVTDEEFANGLAYSVKFVSLQYAVPQMKRLAASSSPVIRSAACSSLINILGEKKLRDLRNLCGGK